MVLFNFYKQKIQENKFRKVEKKIRKKFAEDDKQMSNNWIKKEENKNKNKNRRRVTIGKKE